MKNIIKIFLIHLIFYVNLFSEEWPKIITHSSGLDAIEKI